MVLLVLLLLCSCLGCLREGVWTKYTPADVARWQAQATEEMAAPRLPPPPHTLVASHPPHRSVGPNGNTATARRQEV